MEVFRMSTATIPTSEIEAIIEYLWHEEEKYNASEKSEDGIFHRLRVVKEWLDQMDK
jgi:hypothetical protein